MVNAQGANMGAFKEGQLDTLSIPGENLTLSIDLPLQQYAERLMQGKVGSVIALEPASGEILVWVSAPSYPPSALAGRDFGVNYQKLVVDSLKPLFNRPIMAAYPPGSIFKIVQGLVALEEGVIGENEKIYCDGSLIGDHAPRGYYDMRRGIMLSSNNFFVKVFRRMINQQPEMSPLAKWKANVSRFGFGKPLGVDIPNEADGFIPGTKFYNKVYGEGRWKFSNLISLSIGQGELLINPIQMANLAAIMANRGYYYRPHLVKAVGDRQDVVYKERVETGVSPVHFPTIIAGMADALRGTAPRAFMKDIAICGKTGTVQNPHGEDHSVFIAFAPREDPQIALSVVVENAGWGGRAAASIASLLIESYLKGEITRPWLESYVLAGDFLGKKKKQPRPKAKPNPQDSATTPPPSFQDSTSQKTS